MCFNNLQVHPQWRGAWKSKENALKERYVKTLEDLNEHARPLAPLRHGDRVLIQNQRGRYPKKWDNSGTIVETKPNDQYVVKVSGSGRLTIRNRRFLRLYEQHNLHQSSPDKCLTPTIAAKRPMLPTVTEHPVIVQNSDATSPCKQPCTLNHTPLPGSPVRPNLETMHPSQTIPTRLSFGDIPPQSTSSETEVAAPGDILPPVVFSPPRRSTRMKKERTVYDADSGSYKAPSSVPDDA